MIPIEKLLEEHEKIGISDCLTGKICRYNGEYLGIKRIEKLLAVEKVFGFCPEVQGGLSTPRDPAEILQGDGIDVWNNESKILTIQGEDVTEEFKNGARIVLKLLKEKNISAVILKEYSPSCASCTIYDGTFSGTKKNGIGVTTALLRKNKVTVYSDEEIKF